MLTSATAISLLLFIVLSGVWVAGHFYYQSVTWNVGGHSLRVQSQSGICQVGRVERAPWWPSGISMVRRRLRPQTRDAGYMLNDASARMGRFGYGETTVLAVPQPVQGRNLDLSTSGAIRLPVSKVTFPHWFSVLWMAVLLGTWIVLRRRDRRRALAGHCPKCGYDLRATPERCPECGAGAVRRALLLLWVHCQQAAVAALTGLRQWSGMRSVAANILAVRSGPRDCPRTSPPPARATSRNPPEAVIVHQDEGRAHVQLSDSRTGQSVAVHACPTSVVDVRAIADFYGCFEATQHFRIGQGRYVYRCFRSDEEPR